MFFKRGIHTKAIILVFLSTFCILIIYNIIFSSENKSINNITMVALGKSGSTYSTTKLASSLDYTIGHMNLWYNDKYMQNFNTGHPKVFKTHIDASQANLDRLRKYVGDKIVVHIRDPRPALLSLVYHLTEEAEKIVSGQTHRKYKKNRVKELQKYLSLSLEEKKNYLVDEPFKMNVQWIEDWHHTKMIEDRKPNGLKIIITSYEELLKDEEVFFAKIYNHYGIDAKDIKHVMPKKDKNVRFRSGKPNEWRSAFSAQQIAKMNESLPQFLLDKFGWER